jgi:hypothetical protein
MCRNFAKTCGWSGGEGRDASSALGSDEVGDDGTDTASHATIARAYEVGRGDCGDEIGAREGGEGGGGCLNGSRPPLLKCHQTWCQGARTGGPRRQQGQVSEA